MNALGSENVTTTPRAPCLPHHTGLVLLALIIRHFFVRLVRPEQVAPRIAQQRRPVRAEWGPHVQGRGTPYTYLIAGDANADGIGPSNFNNDIVYVPRRRTDISLDGNGNAAGLGTAAQQASVHDSLDAFISAEPCLSQQHGRILARNSCRNPWFGALNARLTKAFPTAAGQSLELTADLYNVLNLINEEWGQSRVTTLNPGVPMLQLAGYDESAGRGIYRLQLPGLRQIQDLASRWQMELSLRYVF